MEQALQTAPPLARPVSLRLLWVAVGGVVLLSGAVLLYYFPPGSAWFYPRCVFHRLTGLDCPGCGGLRAAHQLLHGHVRTAFALNPLLVVLVPVLGWMGFRQVWRAVTGRELGRPLKHPAWIWVFFMLVVVFGIVRNLPIAPFH